MDDPQYLDSQSSKERAWTTDEIRKHSSNWSLAGDVGLFNLLNEISHNIISRTHDVENAVDSLVHQTKMTSVKINNVINDFHMLSNLQFVENRVYDEEVVETVPEAKAATEKTKVQKEAEMLPNLMKAIELGLAVLDTAFDRINVNEISDSEDEEDISSEGRIILEPKDPYESRPLPYIIGSEEFMKCDYAGLKELVEEEVQSFSEESSLSESDETSSDEEPLPLDDDKFSDKVPDQGSQNISDRISSSDESELFGSAKDVNGYKSDTSVDFKEKEKNIQRPPEELAKEIKSRQSSISSMQSKLKLPQVLPVPKLKENKEDDMFAHDEENSDDESPFRKRTGLFTSDIRFDDEKDGSDLFGDDLFGNSPAKDVKKAKPPDSPKSSKKPAEIISQTKKDNLFDNDDDSEYDIFESLMKAKKPPISKTSTAGSQDSFDKAETLSTPSSAPSVNPAGNAYGFATGGDGGNSLFADESDSEDLFTTKKFPEKKKFDLDTPGDDDLFGNLSSKSLKENKEKQISKPKPPALNKAPTKTQGLFDDDDLEEDIFTQAKKKPEPEKIKSSNLFSDDSKVAKSKDSKIKEKSKVPSLFDDDEAKKKPEPEKIKSSNLFADDSKVVKSKDSEIKEKSKVPSLFDDDEDDSFSFKPKKQETKASSLFEEDPDKDLPKNVPKKETSKTLSLFEDSGNYDLFMTKPPAKKLDSPLLSQVSTKPDLEDIKVKDEIDGASTSKAAKETEPLKLKTEDEKSSLFEHESNQFPPDKNTNADGQISFDTPVDNTGILNVINKGRVKMPNKRRKPTRQGRLAALESSEKETEPVIESVTDTKATAEDSEDLFSTTTKPKVEAEPPKLDYKQQEKKKMNLMSQLIAEVATSKLKKTVVEEDDDEDIDIFSEAAKRDRAGSSFSFKPPEQNGISSMFPINKEVKNEETAVAKPDSFEDDFFTEPAFQNFRSSISHKESLLNLDDDDDDDLFSTTKISSLSKPKPDSSDTNDLFDDDTDIFAHVQKEKYEMFPSQVYDEEDDDIFGAVNITPRKESSSKSNSSSVKKAETKQVNVFEDPLTGLLGED